MIIEKIRTGSYGKHTVYIISNSVSDTGGNHPDEIVRFDDLPTAVLVLKYMRGDNLTPEEKQTAKDALREASHV